MRGSSDSSESPTIRARDCSSGFPTRSGICMEDGRSSDPNHHLSRRARLPRSGCQGDPLAADRSSLRNAHRPIPNTSRVQPLDHPFPVRITRLVGSTPAISARSVSQATTISRCSVFLNAPKIRLMVLADGNRPRKRRETIDASKSAAAARSVMDQFRWIIAA